jgi:hypothetical protein
MVCFSSDLRSRTLFSLLVPTLMKGALSSLYRTPRPLAFCIPLCLPTCLCVVESLCPSLAVKRLTPVCHHRIIACRKRKEPLYPQSSSGGAAGSPGPAASSSRASTSGTSHRNTNASANAGVATTAQASAAPVVVQPDAVRFVSALSLDSAGVVLLVCWAQSLTFFVSLQEDDDWGADFDGVGMLAMEACPVYFYVSSPAPLPPHFCYLPLIFDSRRSLAAA